MASSCIGTYTDAIRAGQFGSGELENLKTLWTPALKLKPSDSAKDKNVVARTHCKEVLLLATSGLEALSPKTWTLELSEALVLALQVMGNLHRCQLLKGAPLEVEKMWFNFARKTLAAGKAKQTVPITTRLLQLLASRSSSDAVGSYMPVANDDAARVHLSACALVCHIGALAEAAPAKLLLPEGAHLWNQSMTWISAVEDTSKRAQCEAELGRAVASVTSRFATETESRPRRLTPAMAECFPWANVLVLSCHVAARTQQGKSSLGEYGAALVSAVEDAVARAPLDCAVNDALLTSVAKKMEEIRKTLAVPGGHPPDASLASALLAYGLAAGKAPPRMARIIPYAVEAVGVVAVARAAAGDVASAASALMSLETLLGASELRLLASKYYNVGVAIHPAAECVSFFGHSCRLLRSCDGVDAAALAERHRVWCTAAVNSSRSREALEASLWWLCYGGGEASAERIASLWSSDAEAVAAPILEKCSPAALRALLRACRFRASATCTLSSLIFGSFYSDAVEKALLMRSSGRTAEAIPILEQSNVWNARVWLAVFKTELGGPFDASLLEEALSSLDDEGPVLDADILESLRGAGDFARWVECEGVALQCEERCGGCTYGMRDAERYLDAGDWANARHAISPQGSLSNAWDLARLEMAKARLSFEVGDAAASLGHSIASLQHCVAAAALQQQQGSAAFEGWLDPARAQWYHLRTLWEAAMLCGDLHEHFGLVLEAEYLWTRARALCPAPAAASRLLCVVSRQFVAAIRRGQQESAAKLRAEIEELMASAQHSPSALAIACECLGDACSSLDEAAEWYSLATADGRPIVKVKLASARDDIEALNTLYKNSAYGHARARALFALATKGDDEALLREAVVHPQLESRLRRSAATLAASAVAKANKAPDVSSLLLAASAGITCSLQVSVRDWTAKQRNHSNTTTLTTPTPTNGSADDDLASVLASLTLSPLAGPLEERIVIPANWTVVHVMAVERAGVIEALAVSHEHAGRHEVRILRQGAFDKDVGAARAELVSIIAASDASTKRVVVSSADKKRWWADRKILDDRLKSLLCALETGWFGEFRSLLRPPCTPADALNCLKRAHSAIAAKKGRVQKKPAWNRVDEWELARVASSAAYLLDGELESALVRCCGGALNATECAQLRAAFQSQCDAAALSPAGPVILVVGTGLEGLPWESLPVLRSCSVTRMPSREAIERRLRDRVVGASVNPALGYYILNPSADLARTQTTFESPFRDQRGWSGIAGVPPTPEQFCAGLTRYDVFVYCGHNSGEQYLRREQLERMTDPVRPVSLLMGCSSAALRDLGVYDPAGVVLSYVQARCPAVVGNLWDVTDSDIDRYLAALLQEWLDEGAGRTPLLQCAADARDSCLLKYLIGAAVVVWGLPSE